MYVCEIIYKIPGVNRLKRVEGASHDNWEDARAAAQEKAWMMHQVTYEDVLEVHFT